MENYGYKVEDSGKMGKTFERDLKALFSQKAIVAKQGKIDFRRDRKCYEVKTGAGELDYLLKSSIKFVVYVPVVHMDLPIDAQEGFILNRADFLQILEEVGLIREKTSTAGAHKVTIQTFWNNKKNAPHGAKYEKLLDRLYDSCVMTLEEYIDADGKI